MSLFILLPEMACFYWDYSDFFDSKETDYIYINTETRNRTKIYKWQSLE